MYRVAVVGGGISGLASAYFLRERAKERGVSLDLTLIEAGDRFGGKIVTERIDQFLVEGGADSFLASKPHAVSLCERLGLSSRLVGTIEANRKTFILSRGRLLPLPEGVVLMVPTKPFPFITTPLISVAGKVRMALEPLISPRREESDESLAAFFTRRLGREVFEKIVEPLVSGIYGGDAREISLAATFPRFAEMERKEGSLIRALLRSRGKGKSGFMTLPGGMGEMVDALLAALKAGESPADLRMGEPVVGIDRADSGWQVRFAKGAADRPFDRVVLALPAAPSEKILRPLAPVSAEELGKIRYLSSATVSLAYRRDRFGHPLNGFGFVVPRAERRALLAATWSSSKFPGRAPADGVLIRGYIGEGSLLSLDDRELVRLVEKELFEILKIEDAAAERIFYRVCRFREAMPQYAVGHLERVERIEKALPPGLFLTGSALRGVGIPDCIREGEATAAKVIESFS